MAQYGPAQRDTARYGPAHLVMRQPLRLGDEQRAAHLALRLGEDVPVLPDQPLHCRHTSAVSSLRAGPRPRPGAPALPPLPSPASLPTGSAAASPLLPAPSAILAAAAATAALARSPRS